MLRRNPTEITLTQKDLIDFNKKLKNKNKIGDKSANLSNVRFNNNNNDGPYNAIEANERNRQQQTLEERLGLH